VDNEGFQQDARRERILIIDDDVDICRYVQVQLQLDGYEVQVAHSGDNGLDQAIYWQPDLVLLDVMMPGMDGTDVCRRLRADPRTIGTAVIFLTAKTQSADKIAGLSAGADDYIAKPFESAELTARVRSALRRNKQMRDVSPLTGLPGNASIHSELERRISDIDTPFAVCWCDLDNFKAFNDHYGFLRGDDAIKWTAVLLSSTVESHHWPHNMVGHIGGDDFVLICDPFQVEAICKEAVHDFDEGIGALYDPEDREAGYIDVPDRRGDMHRYPIMSLSIGVASSVLRVFRSRIEASEAASEMKSFAKAQPGSAFQIDRRRG
jgi:PleD family two-component response regulator